MDTELICEQNLTMDVFEFKVNRNSQMQRNFVLLINIIIILCFICWNQKKTKTSSLVVSCSRSEQVNLAGLPAENVPQFIQAEVECHVCNYWTTGSKKSEEGVGGVGEQQKGWKFGKQATNHWVITHNHFMSLFTSF